MGGGAGWGEACPATGGAGLKEEDPGPGSAHAAGLPWRRGVQAEPSGGGWTVRGRRGIRKASPCSRDVKKGRERCLSEFACVTEEER